MKHRIIHHDSQENARPIPLHPMKINTPRPFHLAHCIFEKSVCAFLSEISHWLAVGKSAHAGKMKVRPRMIRI
jgi:hypothetical protein